MNRASQPRYWRKVVYLGLLIGLLYIPLFGLDVSQGMAAPAMSAYDLVAAVNQLRGANNLPPYRIDPILMAVAQAHSEYQASIGKMTHTGAGGTRAKDRAIAAGYGSGATVYVSENIAGGTSMGIQGAVRMWQGDNLHLDTMLGTSYRDVGAGVAKAGGTTYYTLDVGYIAGSPASGNPGGGNQATSVSTIPTATAIGFFPVVVATPGPDGSITHIVQSGQTLWSIAATYKIALDELLALNNLPRGAWIYPEDELLIKAPEKSPTATEPEAKSTARATATRRPRRTVTKQANARSTSATSTASALAAEKPDLAIRENGIQGISPLLVIAILVAGGVGLIFLGNTLKRNE